MPSLSLHLGPLVAGLLGLLLNPVHAADLAAWKSRTIYQTMTDRFARTDNSTTQPCKTADGLYCGGTWLGTLNQLDYIQGMGFDAVMISPIIENVKGRVSYGEAYHGYWPLDLYSLNEHFGTHDDLLRLSAALHERGMYLMMDVVINNMAYVMKDGGSPATDIDFSTLTPFNNADYYHPYCKITDWNNFTNAQLCQTGDEKVVLPDLYTEHAEVQDILEKWARQTIDTYSIDGLRIDAAKHVDTGFLRKFVDSVEADTFVTGEVLVREVSTICDYQANYIPSMPNYPIYFSMLDALANATTSSLFQEVELMKAACGDVNALVSFSENHDQERVPHKNKDIAIAQNIITFTMLFDGIPMIYQGQEQHLAGGGTPSNREAIWLSGYKTDAPLYTLLATLNALRKHITNLGADYLDSATVPVYRDDGAIAFRKGVEGRHVVMLLSTQSSSQASAFTLPLKVAYNAGTQVTEVLACYNQTVANNGELVVTMERGEPRVFFPSDLMEGSGLCGWPKKNVTLAELKTGVVPAASSSSNSGGSQSRRMIGDAAFAFLLGVVVMTSCQFIYLS
ncbi:glycoside hydrolase superfamily [Aspergillus pseudoustus]|uniref:Alpha-amylase n=1 Tax=Aspergillus pseudoustus TaxID=1810923 RepID=A0ABR4K1G6_9EURO